MSEEKPHPYFDDPDLALARDGIAITGEISSSPTLRYLFEKAGKEAEDAKTEMLQVDPTDTKEIIRLQMVGMIDLKIKTWIVEAIERGSAAEERIRDEDNYPD